MYWGLSYTRLRRKGCVDLYFMQLNHATYDYFDSFILVVLIASFLFDICIRTKL